MNARLPTHAALEDLREEDGCLLFGGERIDRIAAQAGGTPFYVYDRAALDRRIALERQDRTVRDANLGISRLPARSRSEAHWRYGNQSGWLLCAASGGVRTKVCVLPRLGRSMGLSENLARPI